MAVVRSPDFLRALIRETALATLIHQRRLTPSCGGHAPTAERTVGSARMIAESLTPKPGIREQNRPQSDGTLRGTDLVANGGIADMLRAWRAYRRDAFGPQAVIGGLKSRTAADPSTCAILF